MPRPSLKLVHLPNYKGRSSFLVHKILRDDMVDNPALRYPIYSRLPESWRKAFEAKPPIVNQQIVPGTKRPHHSGLWVMKDGQPALADNTPLNIKYTEEVKEGLWGGEGIIQGYKHGKGMKTKPLHEKRWKPMALKRTVYSEVLEREILTTITIRVLDLIDEAYGFDHYILKTPINELSSDLGGRLKREMLLRLLNKDTEMYKHDPEMREKIYNRYKKYIIPKEEAEWVGLTLKEAMEKQWNIEKEQGLHDSVPLLKIYTEELKEKLRTRQEKLESGDQNIEEGPIFNPPKKESS